MACSVTATHTALQRVRTSIIAPAKVVKLTGDKAKAAVFDVEHADNALLLYVQGQSDSSQEHAKMMVLRQMLKTPFYARLRTEEQLGYVVFMGSLKLKMSPLLFLWFNRLMLAWRKSSNR